MNQNGKIIAYCGIICTDCEAYQATQAKDDEALERVAAHWRVEYHAPGITVASVVCDGCLDDAGAKCAHCGECHTRACAKQHGVANCAYCTDYPCAELESFLNFVPAARAVLDEIKAAL